MSAYLVCCSACRSKRCLPTPQAILRGHFWQEAGGARLRRTAAATAARRQYSLAASNIGAANGATVLRKKRKRCGWRWRRRFLAGISPLSPGGAKRCGNHRCRYQHIERAAAKQAGSERATLAAAERLAGKRRRSVARARINSAGLCSQHIVTCSHLFAPGGSNNQTQPLYQPAIARGISEKRKKGEKEGRKEEEEGKKKICSVSPLYVLSAFCALIAFSMTSLAVAARQPRHSERKKIYL